MNELVEVKKKYEIGGEIGSGGAAKVYECQLSNKKPEGVGENLVAKVLHDSSNGRERRFHEEASFLSNLQHPHIIRLFDYFESDRVMVLEKADCSLQDCLDFRTFKSPSSRQRFSTQEKLKVLHQVAMGIQHLHNKGIAHRDLCPSNILVRSDGTVALADLGMSTVGALVLPDDVLGNPKQYAPPEQSIRLLDAKAPADIFAFGMLAYNFLTGSVAKGHPTPRVHDLDPEVPSDIGTLLFNAISYNPEDRPDANEVEQVFARFGPSNPVTALRRQDFSRTGNLPTAFSDFFGVGELLSDISYKVEQEIIRSDYHRSVDFYGLGFKNLATEEVRKRFVECGNARMLLPNGSNDVLIEGIAQKLGKNAEALRDDVEQSIMLLSEVRSDQPTISVRLYDLAPPWRMLLIDNSLLLQRLYGGDREKNHLLKVNDGRYLRRAASFFEDVWLYHSQEIGLG